MNQRIQFQKTPSSPWLPDANSSGLSRTPTCQPCARLVRFQREHLGISQETPGFGGVGPMTRGKLEEMGR
ncbi:hypothetical protein COY31_01765 [Candidatus Wolfebacteria bacterium CG_4_10_14_0_2_um_filter_39_18]|uniref:Peptidoglycan binding-like domain-containing protein n=1 Tax=Candidatus Wolfebacteria bacterium CG_4_10_14_0_2_um_filter_39_18 TaxID=1975061 RepID=A0A2M7TFS5_9BACT|nr:MAG: hypothetical protein COY31_01765 [Candidatus Wolfebacteria bacterium CG_4_10_14_0_2_um_filter_39_18]